MININRIGNTYTINNIEINYRDAQELYFFIRDEYFREDVITMLDGYCEEHNLDVNKISKKTIDKIKEDYEYYRDYDERWSDHVLDAIEDNIKDIYKDLDL